MKKNIKVKYSLKYYCPLLNFPVYSKPITNRDLNSLTNWTKEYWGEYFTDDEVKVVKAPHKKPEKEFLVEWAKQIIKDSTSRAKDIKILRYKKNDHICVEYLAGEEKKRKRYIGVILFLPPLSEIVK
jgi:hypothetical protein